MSETEGSHPIRTLVIAGIVAAVVLALFVSHMRGAADRGEPLGRVHFGRLSGAERSTQTVPTALAAETRLTFAVLMSSYQTTGGRRSDLMLRIEPLRGGEPLVAHDCLGYRVRSSSATGIVGTSNTCAMTVPAPGADALRVTARFDSAEAGMVVEGLSVEVRGEQRRRRDEGEP